MTTITHPTITHRHPGIPTPRAQVDAAELLAHLQPPEPPAPAPRRRRADRRADLNDGRWVTCGAMQVRLS